jgi:hypothetical protein
MSFLDRLVKHGLVHTMSGSSKNSGAFPVTEQDIAQYQEELELRDRALRRGLGSSIGHRRSSSSSSCGSLEDCIIVDQRGLHNSNSRTSTSILDELVAAAATRMSINSAGSNNNNYKNKMRTSSCDDDDIDLIKYNNSGCTFDMSLLPGHDPTAFVGPPRNNGGRWSSDQSSELQQQQQQHNNSAHDGIEFMLDDTATMENHQDRGEGEDNVLLLFRTTKPLTARGNAKQVLLKPLRSSWCFVKSVGERVRKWQRNHHFHQPTFGRRGIRKQQQQQRRFDPTASLEDDDDDDEANRARIRIDDSEEMVEFQMLSSRSGDEDLSLSIGNDNDDQRVSFSSTDEKKVGRQ